MENASEKCYFNGDRDWGVLMTRAESADLA